MCTLNMRVVDTTPGADSVCPFSPPAGWNGGVNEYRTLMQVRYESEQIESRYMIAMAYFAKRETVEVRGPFAAVAQEILHTIPYN